MTFKDELFTFLMNDNKLKLKDLYEKYSDKPKGTVRSYYYEYRRNNSSYNKLLNINELLSFLGEEITLSRNRGTAHRRECIRLYIDIINATGNDIKGKTIIEQFTEWKENK